MEGYIAAVVLGGAAFTMPQTPGESPLRQLTHWSLAAACVLSAACLGVALFLGEWLSMLWSIGLLACCFGVLSRLVSWRGLHWGFGILAVGLGASATAIAVISLCAPHLLPPLASELIGTTYRNNVIGIVIGDLLLSLTASVIGAWSLRRNNADG